MREAFMPTHAETQFYIHRERQERALADRTPNSDGRRVHLDMARRYAKLIAEGEAQEADDRRPS
ncbi:hypothetical protein SR41_11155 [Sphingomonas melonis]|uniref:Uncharacterized protein n=1 Tax=Sphingomonas melonis TaxID=152682 RepID=A0A0D1K0Y7_9SPHN|nr:hypothetical protein SR41_11155 [Sphingomonas melonis]